MKIMSLEIEIKEKVRHFFDLINHPQIKNYYIKNFENWDALCAALHIIHDLQRPKEEYHLLKKINYLETIGIIQSIYIEQDSVETLKFAITEQNKQRRFNLSNYEEIRKIRNQIFGHPSEKREGKIKTRHFFDIEDSEKKIVKHIFWGTKTEIDTEYFIISDLIFNNSKITLSYLEEIEQEIKLKFEKSMDNYSIKFETLFKSATYIFSKLLTKENDRIAIDAYFSIDDDIEKAIQGLNERAVLQDYKQKFEVIRFLSKKLKILFDNQTFRDIEFYTYASTLRDKINELKKELKEVDNIFEK